MKPVKSQFITLRVTERQKEVIKNIADKHDMTISEYMLNCHLEHIVNQKEK